jgi:glyoxylase-like metal-dependent hydrolase (beta-lactamase superfamily II)
VKSLVEQILPGLYRLEIPLPASPLKTINSYVLISKNRNLIIDTGLNRPECVEAMLTGLAELAVDMEKTDIFLTHMHADHTGLVHVIKTPSSAVFASAPDAAVINSFADGPFRWQPMLDYACLNGFSAIETKKALQRHPGFLFGPKGQLDFTLVGEGSAIDFGDYHFTCVETPGHSKGHICLYEPAKKILISGDHILGDITPNISVWSDSDNPLNIFLDSLAKTAAFDVDLVLPGHRRVFADCRGRIAELIQHHRHRADEVLSILAVGSMNAVEVASRMTWQLTCRSWDEFPAAQKWFATGEALAHLRYLEAHHAVQRSDRDGQIVYSV